MEQNAARFVNFGHGARSIRGIIASIMKLLSLTLALAVGGAGLQTLSTPARAAETAAQRAGRAAIIAAYDKQCQATVKKDVSAIVAFYAPDYALYSKAGRVYNRSETEEMLRRLIGMADRIAATGVKTDSTLATRIVSLTWRGKDAIVMSQTTGVNIAKKGARRVRTETVNLARDYWTPTSQGWKIRQTAERDAKMWLNGERIG